MADPLSKTELKMSPWQHHIERWKDCKMCPLHRTRRNVVLGRGGVPCDVLFVGEAPGPVEDINGSPFTGPSGHLLNSIIEEVWGKGILCKKHGIPLLDGGIMEKGVKYWCPCVTPTGPKGHATNEAIKIRWAFTNLVACIPRDEEDGGKKFGEPPPGCIKSCQMRLAEFIRLADGTKVVERPDGKKVVIHGKTIKLIVCVGALAEKWMDQDKRPSLKLNRSIPITGIIHPAAILRTNLAQKGLLIQRAVVKLRTAVEDFVLQ